MSGLTSDGTLSISVLAVPEEPAVASTGTPWLLTVHGADRPGIVSSVVAEVAAVGGNITDLTTRLTGDLYVLVAELDLPSDVDVAALDAAIDDVAARLGVGATLRRAEADDL
nr:ACT domain-containing protein [Nocardioides sp. MAH-18]